MSYWAGVCYSFHIISIIVVIILLGIRIWKGVMDEVEEGDRLIKTIIVLLILNVFVPWSELM